MSTLRKSIWFLTGILAVTALVLLAIVRHSAPGTESGTNGTKVDVRLGLVAAAGRVEPASEEVKVGSELDGKLARVLVDEGETVVSGQVIAVLENTDFVARVDLARAGVREREAQLERLRNGARQEEIHEAEAQLREAAGRRREAESYLAVAKAEHNRRTQLLARGAVSRSEHDLAVREAETAEARLSAFEGREAAARERLALVRSQIRIEDLRRGEAELLKAQAALREAEAMLAKTYIRSPIKGRILRRYRKAGESVSGTGSTPVFSIGDVSRLRIRADIDETDVARVWVGQKGWVQADAFGDSKFFGRVIRIGEVLGRKNVLTDEPREKVDTKILETLIELDHGQSLPIGLRMDVFLPVSR